MKTKGATGQPFSFPPATEATSLETLNYMAWLLNRLWVFSGFGASSGARKAETIEEKDRIPEKDVLLWSRNAPEASPDTGV